MSSRTPLPHVWLAWLVYLFICHQVTWQEQDKENLKLLLQKSPSNSPTYYTCYPINSICILCLFLKLMFAFLKNSVLFWVNNTINSLICSLLFLMFKKHCLKTPLTFNDSPHDGLQQGFSGSMVTGSSGFWNNSKQQSMILIIRWGGFASFLTVAISTGLMVYLKKNVTGSCINTIILFSHSISPF